ncbi:MAG: tyrosine-type recombinase/integrase [Thauera sp.]|jgi:integrase|nr:tyrosine-type recombinase/integrase [Thauera sp.]
MASIQKTATGWRAQIKKAGVRLSETFATQKDAKAWAAEHEAKIERRQILPTGKRAEFREVLQRTLEEVSLSRTDELRVKALLSDHLAGVMLPDLGPQHFAEYRDRRLKQVSPATVIREFRTIGSVCTRAVEEWKWMSVHPVRGVKLPPDPERRKRRVYPHEIEAICISGGYHRGTLETKTAYVCAAFLFAIETGMRAGEIRGLDRSRIAGKVAHLPKTKNGSARDVPLSPAALSILDQMPPELWQGITAASLDALWRKIRNRAGIDDLHFHDSRHEAVTRLSKKLNVLELARMIGHKDIRELMTYYEDDAEEVAGKL